MSNPQDTKNPNQVQRYSIDSLETNPWHFRIASEKNLKNITYEITKRGIASILPPVVAVINKKTYIVDGHARVLAIKRSGLNEIRCIKASWIKTYKDLRVWSFRLNTSGYSNPLTLSDMISEDLKLSDGDINLVAQDYGVSVDYVTNLARISKLNDDTKAIIQKLISIASRKYQFLLEQITPAHISSLADLESAKQLEVVNWIFNDIIYGPPNESQISIPSILEIVQEIQRIQESASPKKTRTYKKKNTKTNKNLSIPDEIPFKCKCGLCYEINLKSNKVFEYLDFKDIKVKKEFVSPSGNARVYSSSDYSIYDMMRIVKNYWKKATVRVIVDEESDADEGWK